MTYKEIVTQKGWRCFPLVTSRVVLQTGEILPHKKAYRFLKKDEETIDVFGPTTLEEACKYFYETEC